MALATTGVQGTAAKAKPARSHGPIPRTRNGYRGRLSQTWSAQGGAFKAARSILCLRRLVRRLWNVPSQNGEGGKTQIGKAPGGEKGPPQADRDGTRAGGCPRGPAPLRAKEGRRSPVAGAARRRNRRGPDGSFPGERPLGHFQEAWVDALAAAEMPSAARKGGQGYELSCESED